jgi:hypothetical protein
VKHRNIEYIVGEIEPHKWRWEIQGDEKFMGDRSFPTREAAVAACIEAINSAIERGKGARRNGTLSAKKNACE